MSPILSAADRAAGPGLLPRTVDGGPDRAGPRSAAVCARHPAARAPEPVRWVPWFGGLVLDMTSLTEITAVTDRAISARPVPG